MLRHENEEYVERLASLETGGEDETKKIPRPKGTAGKEFSLQVAMGLATSDKKNATYQGLIVSSHCASVQ